MAVAIIILALGKFALIIAKAYWVIKKLITTLTAEISTQKNSLIHDGSYRLLLDNSFSAFKYITNSTKFQVYKISILFTCIDKHFLFQKSTFLIGLNAPVNFFSPLALQKRISFFKMTAIFKLFSILTVSTWTRWVCCC